MLATFSPIIKQVDSEDRIYMLRKTMSSSNELKMHLTESTKIKTAPENWTL